VQEAKFSIEMVLFQNLIKLKQQKNIWKN